MFAPKSPKAAGPARPLFTALVLALLSVPGASTDDASVRKASVENGLRQGVNFGELETFTVEEGIKRTGVPGISVTVIKGGKIDWTAGYGTKTAGSTDSISADTLFQAASLSKPMTVFAAMRMHEAGLIDLDKNIQDYLSSYRLPQGKQSAENPVTFRNLLSHLSGINAGGYMGYAVGAEVPTDLQVLEGQKPANTPAIFVENTPGTLLRYSGGGYTLAEQAMQDVTSSSFTDLMKTWALAPLGASKASFAQPLPSQLHEFAATGHSSNGEPVEGGWRVHPEQAAAGLWTSSSELAAMLTEIYNAKHSGSDLLSAESAELLMSEQRDGHAYGFILSGENDTLAIRHFGGNLGFRGMIILYPNTGDGAVLLANSDNGSALIEQLAKAISATYDWPDFKQVESQRVELPADTLQSFVGRYRYDYGVEVSVSFDANQNAIALHFPNGDRYQMVPTGARDFIHPETAVTLSFEESGDLRLYGGVAAKVDDKDK